MVDRDPRARGIPRYDRESSEIPIRNLLDTFLSKDLPKLAKLPTYSEEGQVPVSEPLTRNSLRSKLGMDQLSQKLKWARSQWAMETGQLLYPNPDADTRYWYDPLIHSGNGSLGMIIDPNITVKYYESSSPSRDPEQPPFITEVLDIKVMQSGDRVSPHLVPGTHVSVRLSDPLSEEKTIVYAKYPYGDKKVQVNMDLDETVFGELQPSHLTINFANRD